MADDGKTLQALSHPRILVLGDLILDLYVQGEVRRISPEAPIPVFEGGQRTFRLGGAGNVAANLKALEAEVAVAGLIGADEEGARLQTLLRTQGIEAAGVLVAQGRPTTRKTRFLSRDHQLLRWDEEEAGLPDPSLERRLREFLDREIPGFSALVLSDYAKGVLGPPLIRSAVSRARAAGIPVIVDPKGRDYTRYRGVSLITPNRAEAELATGIALADDAALEGAARNLLEALELEAAVITLGKDGIFFRTREGRQRLLPAQARSVYDVTGAGDTVVAVLALCRACGVDLEQALRLCNLAAGIVVGRLGAVSVTRTELSRELGQGPAQRKILDRRDLPAFLAGLDRPGRRLVFANGCFDVLHAGHVQFLQSARREGDLLLVAVNADDSVRRLKGSSRPVNPLADRMLVLAALEAVDHVVAFDEETPEALIRETTPDVLVKGEDWREKGVVGREWVEAHGGRVVLVSLVEGRSTTALLARLAEGGAEGAR